MTDTVVVDAKPYPDTGEPSRLYSTIELAELALQRVGAMSPMDDAADDIDLARTLDWMEILIADRAGKQRLQWLIPETIEFELQDDTRTYVLSDIAGAAFPSRRIAYPIAAWMNVNGGGDKRVQIIRRTDYEDIITKTTSGQVNKIYIDRTVNDPVLYTYPVKSADTTTIKLRIEVATFAPSVLGKNADPDQIGDQPHGLPRAWQLWFVHATACEIGDGPVRQLGDGKLNRLMKIRDGGLMDLTSFDNRENKSMRRSRTRRYGG